MEYRWHLRLWWRLGVVGINFSFLFLVSALPWQGLFRSEMLASPWLGLLRCHGSFSTYIHTHPWGHLLYTTLCQMGLAFSCLLRSPSRDANQSHAEKWDLSATCSEWIGPPCHIQLLPFSCTLVLLQLEAHLLWLSSIFLTSLVVWGEVFVLPYLLFLVK